MKRLFVLFVAIAVPAFAQESQLVTPQLSKPATEAAAGDAQHEKYEAAWFRYEQAIAKVTADVNAALDAQFEKAADAGNLDLADMWDKKKKAFLDTGTVSWPSDAKAKAEWRRQYPTAAFPEELNGVVAEAQASFQKAVATLKEDYESLVKDYTKGRNLARAKALRDELAGLSAGGVSRPAAAAEPKGTALFDGRTLKGWRFVRSKSTPQSLSPWSVDQEKGVLVAAPGTHSWLETEKRYSNYTLRLEYRFQPDRKISGNGSGVVIGGRGLRPDGYDPVGIEVDLNPTNALTGMFIGYGSALARGGDRATAEKRLFRLAALEPPQEKHLGEWNSLEVRNAGGRVEVSVNGRLVNQADEVSTDPGAICLRTQDSHVEFRNITLETEEGSKPDR